MGAATFTVTTSSDSGPGSLREAIAAANLNADTSTITFSLSSPATLTLASALPPIAANIAFVGPGADDLTVASLSCSSGSGSGEVEEYTSGASGLQNLGGGYYQFNWATPKSYANTCKTMHLDLGEGTTHTALFKFIR